MGQLENDESMVYVHIRDAQNEGKLCESGLITLLLTCSCRYMDETAQESHRSTPDRSHSKPEVLGRKRADQSGEISQGRCFVASHESFSNPLYLSFLQERFIC